MLSRSAQSCSHLCLQFGLFAADIIAANVNRRKLPYKVTFVATYHCNFRCEMCSIWKKDSVDEMTPAEVDAFFRPHRPASAGST